MSRLSFSWYCGCLSLCGLPTSSYFLGGEGGGPGDSTERILLAPAVRVEEGRARDRLIVCSGREEGAPISFINLISSA
jgi:hypothetical protein